MLSLIVPATEFYNEKTQEFLSTKETIVSLEHSLISISKWESRWKKPFLSKKPITKLELSDYIKCMSVGTPLDENTVTAIINNRELVKTIQDYIDNPMTATTIRDNPNSRPNNEIITSELIYYWMIEHGIPFECQKWHINRLLTLIRICGIKGSSPKKMSKKEIMEQNRALNAARRAKTGSKG